MRRSHKKMFLHKNALSQKRSDFRPLGWKNFGECSIRLRWGSQHLGSFLLTFINSNIHKIKMIKKQLGELSKVLQILFRVPFVIFDLPASIRAILLLSKSHSEANLC
ncbi:MAG: hypothetical protein ACI9P5_004908 [Saprospiraceae bacterium]